LTRELTLYGHGWCSLCDEMYAQLLPLATEFKFSINVVDIHDEPELEARFGEDVPVLCAGTTELCRHRLDTESLQRYFGAG